MGNYLRQRLEGEPHTQANGQCAEGGGKQAKLIKRRGKERLQIKGQGKALTSNPRREINSNLCLKGSELYFLTKIWNWDEREELEIREH